MMKEILIDEFSRHRLARWLEGKGKPPKISEEDWERLLKAELCAASFGLIAALCDWHGGEVLDVLRVTESRIYNGKDAI